MSNRTVMVRRGLVLCAFASLGLFASGATASRPHTTPQLVYVLAGQSNIDGRARPLGAGAKPSRSLLVLKKRRWKVARDPIPSSSGLSRGEPGVGPTMTFGLRILATHPGATVGVVMCAVGRTSIADWRPGGRVYASCLQAIRRSGAHVAGIVFLQGETEARTCKPWLAGFEQLEAAFESDLGPVPFVLGQIGALTPTEAWPCVARVQQQQAQAAAGLGIPLVPTSDLPIGPDGIHFTVAGQLELGRRFADAMNAAGGG